MQENYDVVIIGSGVAGMTAALYLKRSSISTLLIEEKMPGGQMAKTSEITNYPGFKSISGVELTNKILSQLKEVKAEIKMQKVVEIKIDGEFKKVILEDQKEIVAKNVIIATGRKPKKLDLANEDKLFGNGVSYCATCDGPLYKNQSVVVIGSGDSAVEEAIYLASFCEKVTLISRSNQLRAKSYLQEELKYMNNIEVIKEANVIKLIEKEGTLAAVQIERERQIENIPAAGCFIYIGFIPETEIFASLDITDQDGYIITDEHMETKLKGIYAIGDVRKKEVCQIVTAEGDGACAAVYLSKNIS